MMQSVIVRCIWIAVLVLSRSALVRDTLTVEIPTGTTGEVQVTEIVSRLAKASGVAFELPAAGMILATQGLAGPLTRTLLSEARTGGDDCLSPRGHGHFNRRASSGGGQA